MDIIKEIFDSWAVNGRSELMEKEHAKTVLKFLKSNKFEGNFTFLDVGCGNGWVVRQISKLENCKKAIGIDKSKNMIENAKSKKESLNESYFAVDVKNWKYKEKFDFIFSMETLYYSIPMEPTLKKIYSLLKKNGKFFCGTDFYKDNTATVRWEKQMKVPLDLRTKKEWKKMFESVGFLTKIKQVKDYSNKKQWKRKFGTLFIIGIK